jgi:hypothetical protein
MFYDCSAVLRVRWITRRRVWVTSDEEGFQRCGNKFLLRENRKTCASLVTGCKPVFICRSICLIGTCRTAGGFGVVGLFVGHQGRGGHEVEDESRARDKSYPHYKFSKLRYC